MRRLVLVVLVLGCRQRASSPPIESKPAESKPAVTDAALAIDAAPSSCDLDGRYRLRFRTNGADGWWMRLNVVNHQASVGSDADMLGLAEATPVTTVDLATCALTVTARTAKHGEIRVALVIAGNQVAGTLARSDEHEDKISPIAGLRETTPPEVPACLHPGVYEVAVTNVKTWKTDGTPSFGSCRELADLHTPRVRLELLGRELYVDEVHSEPPYRQTFGRAQVRREGDCRFTLSLEVQDFRLHEAKLELRGDKVTGTTTDFTYDVMEDGEAGENLWSCHAQHGDVILKRVAD